jgi:LytS/YehU family sensor histidine kinase
LRVYEIKHSYDNNTGKLLINAFFMNATALSTTYISVSEMLKGDWIIALVFVLGSVFGKWIAVKKNINGN